MYYSKRHNKFLLPALAGAVYGSFCKAENEISNVINYNTKFLQEMQDPGLNSYIQLSMYTISSCYGHFTMVYWESEFF